MFFLKKFLFYLYLTLKIIIFTLVLTLLIDYIFGNKILDLIDPYLKKTEFYDKRIRVWDKVFHHTFRENVNLEFKQHGKTGKFCTNNLGFKSKCNSQSIKSYKYGFMGDSFTEGIGLNYESTFVGIFENKIGSNVANMGVSSYSPKLHLAKINFYLNKGIQFDHIILFLDISDYYDEAYYNFDEKIFSVVHNKKDKRRIWARENFPLTNFYFYVLKRIKKNPKSYKKIQDKVFFDESVKRKTAWLDKELDEFKINGETVSKIHEDTKYYIDQIYNILNEKGIKFSLAIYPWPQNLINKKNNFFYRNEWKKFCINRCEYFFDYFEEFNNQLKFQGFEKVYKKYFFYNDVHFNKEGNILLSEKLISKFLSQQ